MKRLINILAFILFVFSVFAFFSCLTSGRIDWDVRADKQFEFFESVKKDGPQN